MSLTLTPAPMSLTVSHVKRRWSLSERCQLLELASEGVPTRVIARRIGRTPLAIRLMACRSRIRLVGRRPLGRVSRLRTLLPPSMEASIVRMAARFQVLGRT